MQEKEIEMQRTYYATTASRYDLMHGNGQDEEHVFAMMFLAAAIEFNQIRSVLDVGAGTGRVVKFLKNRYPDLYVVGIEPVQELREIGHQKGIPEDALIDGDTTNLEYRPGEFDLVCEFGVLHHIKNPEVAVSEMLRVAGRAIFLSDSNNFGQGALIYKIFKQFINMLGLWKVADAIKTRGRGYSITEGDGLAYSYSVFNNYKKIREQCERVHLFNTKDAHINPYTTAGHVALLGLKTNKSSQQALEYQ